MHPLKQTMMHKILKAILLRYFNPYNTAEKTLVKGAMGKSTGTNNRAFKPSTRHRILGVTTLKKRTTSKIEILQILTIRYMG